MCYFDQKFKKKLIELPATTVTFTAYNTQTASGSHKKLILTKKNLHAHLPQKLL